VLIAQSNYKSVTEGIYGKDIKERQAMFAIRNTLIWSLFYCVLAFHKFFQFSTNAITIFCCLSRSERQMFTDLSGAS